MLTQLAKGSVRLFLPLDLQPFPHILSLPLPPPGYSVAGSRGAPPCQRQSALLALRAASLRRQALRLEGGTERRKPLRRNPSWSFARGQQRQVSEEDANKSSSCLIEFLNNI